MIARCLLGIALHGIVAASAAAHSPIASRSVSSDDAESIAVRLDPERVRVGEVARITLDVTGEGAVDSELLDLPRIDGLALELESGPDVSRDDSSGAYVARYVLVARPLRSGEFSIDGLKVLVRSDVTAAASVVYLRAEASAETAVAFTVTAPAPTVWVNEPFAVRVRIERDAPAPPALRRSLRLPWLKSTVPLVDPLTPRPDHEQYEIEGMERRLHLVRGEPAGGRVVIEGEIPLIVPQPGVLDFAGSLLRIDPRITGDYREDGAEVAMVEVPAPPASVTVKPLPPGAPPEFVDGVGDFDVAARLDRAETGVGELVRLSIAVRAVRGSRTNLSNSSFARVESIPGFRVLGRRDERSTDSLTIHLEIAAAAGNVDAVPPLRLAWFEPRSGEFRTGSTERLPILVKSTAPPAPPAGEDAVDEPLDVIDRIRANTLSVVLVALAAVLGFALVRRSRVVAIRDPAAAPVRVAKLPREEVDLLRGRLIAATDPYDLATSRDLARFLAARLGESPGACFGPSVRGPLERGAASPALVARIVDYFTMVEERAFAGDPSGRPAARPGEAIDLRKLVAEIEDLGTH